MQIMSCAGAAGIYKSWSNAKIKVDAAASVSEVLRHSGTGWIEIQKHHDITIEGHRNHKSLN